jgi:hypothetical protein
MRGASERPAQVFSFGPSLALVGPFEDHLDGVRPDPRPLQDGGQRHACPLGGAESMYEKGEAEGKGLAPGLRGACPLSR